MISEKDMLLEYLDSIIALVDVSTITNNTLDFLVNRFKLSNCTLYWEDKAYRFYDSVSAYESFEKELLNTLREFKVPQTGRISGALPSNFLAIPIINDRRMVGSIIMYSENLIGNNIDIVSKILDKFMRAVRLAVKYEAVWKSAVTDKLTGVFNRGFFMEALQREISIAAGKPTTVAMLDIDNFKQYNDTHGHLEGDVILTKVAQTLQGTIRPGDICARYGGEEFVIVMPETDAPAGNECAEQVRNAIEKNCSVTVSVGVATASISDVCYSTMLKHADSSMYKSKRAGKNKVSSTLIMNKDLIIDSEAAASMGKY